MIADLILAPVKILFFSLLDLLPTLDTIVLPSNFFSWFTDILSLVAYMLPLGHMFAIFGAWIFFTYFHVTWAVLQRIWDALPIT